MERGECLTGEKEQRYLNAFQLKILAIIGMTLDHVGVVYGEFLPLWAKCAFYSLGGLTFPIMAYLLSEGYRNTGNLKRYMERLFLFAAVAQVPYMWVLSYQLNVMFTLLLGLAAIHLTSRATSKAVAFVIVTAFTMISLFCDWAIIGIPMILIYYYTENQKKRVIYPIVVAGLLIGLFPAWSVISGDMDKLPELFFYFIGCILTIPLLMKYSGARGFPLRYFFYIYYPAHLIVLGAIRGIVFNIWL